MHGLIFLFKWQSSQSGNGADDKNESDGSSSSSSRGTPLTGDDVPEGLFFAKQVTHNAVSFYGFIIYICNCGALYIICFGCI